MTKSPDHVAQQLTAAQGTARASSRRSPTDRLQLSDVSRVPGYTHGPSQHALSCSKGDKSEREKGGEPEGNCWKMVLRNRVVEIICSV